MMELRLPAGPLDVVLLAAHPDDVEIGCGGTLLTLAARGGVRAASLTFTAEGGRQEEGEAAAAAFFPGTRTTFASLPDGRLPAVWDEVKRTLHAFAKSCPEPDLVFAPRSTDAHQDHRLVGSLASTVWRNSLVLHYEIPKWDGDLGHVTTYVPVEDQLAARKWELLDTHYASQRGRDWWDRDVILGLMRLRGVECRHRYAEGFVIEKSLIGLGVG